MFLPLFHSIRYGIKKRNPISRISSLILFISMYLQNCTQTFHLKPFTIFLPWPSGQALDRLVAVSSMPYGTSTPALSTSSSSRGLTLTMGYLILRGASRLDAFSVYPVPTWLPGYAFGNATGTPEVSPSRSSRTKDSSSQISYAHAG